MRLTIKSFLSKIFKAICFFCITALTLVMAIQVVTRQMKISLPWCEELSRFLLIWLTFSGSAVALDEKLHLSVNFFVNLAPGKLRKMIEGAGKLIVMLFFCSISFYGITLSSKTMSILSPTMRWPMGLVYLILPITSIYCVINIALSFFEREEVESI